MWKTCCNFDRFFCYNNRIESAAIDVVMKSIDGVNGGAFIYKLAVMKY